MFCGEMYDYINTTHNINKCFIRRNGADFEQINNYNKGQGSGNNGVFVSGSGTQNCRKSAGIVYD